MKVGQSDGSDRNSPPIRSFLSSLLSLCSEFMMIMDPSLPPPALTVGGQRGVARSLHCPPGATGGYASEVANQYSVLFI